MEKTKTMSLSRMLRGSSLLLLPALAGVLTVIGCGGPPAPRVAQQARRPNIIFLLTDDMDNSAQEHMPVLQTQFMKRGTTFRNMFVTDSVCCPSRASILRGQYVHNHSVLDNKVPIGSYKKFLEYGHESSTMATWLTDAGYRTTLIGKYINFYPIRENTGAGGPNHVPPGWTEWYALFFAESYYDYEMNENGRVRRYGEEPENYQTDVLEGKALNFIKRTPDSQPFFMHLSVFAPHSPAIPAERHKELFPELRAPRIPSFNEEDLSGKPNWVRAAEPMSEDTIGKTDAWHRRRVRCLQAVDEMLGHLIESLQARGFLENTYIFFTSDNGFQLGAHRMDHGKGDGYEESIRVPLVVRGPGVPADRKLDQFVLNIDFAPTFAELAGAKVPSFVDGASFVPLLGSHPPTLKNWRKDFLVEHWINPKDVGGIPEYAELRNREYAYIEYPSGERELYDMQKDPYELRNLYTGGDPGLLQRLSGRLATLKACKGETCRE